MYRRLNRFAAVSDDRAGGDELAAYLDGYAYHAAPDKNRLVGDADQRARLRAEGIVVFQLNWDDVNAAAGDTGGQHQPWHPYQGNAETAARGAYTQLGGDPAELPGLIWTTPVRTLFAFLADPDRAAWSRRAQAAVAGLLRQPGAQAVKGNQADVPERTRLALHGQPLPSGGDGPVTLVRATDVTASTRPRSPRPGVPGWRRPSCWRTRRSARLSCPCWARCGRPHRLRRTPEPARTHELVEASSPPHHFRRLTSAQ